MWILDKKNNMKKEKAKMAVPKKEKKSKVSEKVAVETPKTISVKMVEYYNTMVVREPVQINVADYPELNGMSEEEMKDYIKDNWSDMKSTNEEWYDSLYDECMQSDVMREKITGEEQECYFD
jgi:hypothetical protein